MFTVIESDQEELFRPGAKFCSGDVGATLGSWPPGLVFECDGDRYTVVGDGDDQHMVRGRDGAIVTVRRDRHGHGTTLVVDGEPLFVRRDVTAERLQAIADAGGMTYHQAAVAFRVSRDTARDWICKSLRRGLLRKCGDVVVLTRTVKL